MILYRKRRFHFCEEFPVFFCGDRVSWVEVLILTLDVSGWNLVPGAGCPVVLFVGFCRVIPGKCRSITSDEATVGATHVLPSTFLTDRSSMIISGVFFQVLTP